MLYHLFLLLFVLFSSGVVSQSMPYPNTPLQFSANVTITTGGFFPQVTHGYWMYDALNQKYRADMAYSTTISSIYDYSMMMSYNWDNQAGYCSCYKLIGTQLPNYVPYGATYLGQSVIRDDPVTVWNINDPRAQANKQELQIYVDKNNFVIRVNITYVDDDTWASLDFSNIIVGQPNPAIFKPTALCTCPPLPPPPTIKPCPTTPGIDCQCADPSQLKFCTLVNYPVSVGIDIEETDLFVTNAFKQVMSTLTNPSPTCQNNFKSFLCAYYFSACTGDNDLLYGQTYLPCQGMCPSCSCGSMATANCTYSLNGPCTAYGNFFC